MRLNSLLDTNKINKRRKIVNKFKDELYLTWLSQAWSLLYIRAAPKLLAGLMPVPVIGIVAKCTRNTAKPIGKGAKI